ncbi:MAG: contractile injection system protein, VgrG/Pvc8 family [Pyrinomonadaceae bacterium]
MAQLSLSLTVDGEPATDLLASLVGLEVEDDHRLASALRMRLAVTRRRDGVWTALDEDRVRLWSTVSLSVGFGGEETRLFGGYVTQLRPHFEPDESRCFYEVVALDATSLMSVEEKLRAWPDRSDSEVAREIFAAYNLTPEVEETPAPHAPGQSVLIQRETDIHFLKRLARRNGFECYVRGDRGVFRRPVLSELPQSALAAHFGAETTLSKFDAHANGLRPTAVEMSQLDPVSKQLQEVVVEQGAQRRLGRDAAPAAASATSPWGLSARTHVRHAVAASRPEMENLCRAIYDEAEWFVEAEGEVDAIAYGSVLEARRLVPVKGVGEMFSGLYYVTNVRHVFGLGSYVQRFNARRNALAPLGAHEFAGGAALAGGL